MDYDELQEIKSNPDRPTVTQHMTEVPEPTAKRRMMQVIKAWIDQYGTEATFDKIIRACVNIGNLALAEKLEEDGMDG